MAVVEIISNIHDATDESEAEQQQGERAGDNMSDQKAKSAQHFLNILMALEEQITRTTDLGGDPEHAEGQAIQVVEPNIVLTTISAPPRESNTGLSFVIVKSNVSEQHGEDEENGFRDENIKTLKNNEALPPNTRTSISLPASLFNIKNENGNYQFIEFQTVGVSEGIQHVKTRIIVVFMIVDWVGKTLLSLLWSFIMFMVGIGIQNWIWTILTLIILITGRKEQCTYYSTTLRLFCTLQAGFNFKCFVWQNCKKNEIPISP